MCLALYQVKLYFIDSKIMAAIIAATATFFSPILALFVQEKLKYIPVSGMKKREIKKTYNRRKIVAAKIPVSQEIVLNIQQKYQIKNVLCFDININ